MSTYTESLTPVLIGFFLCTALFGVGFIVLILIVLQGLPFLIPTTPDMQSQLEKRPKKNNIVSIEEYRKKKIS